MQLFSLYTRDHLKIKERCLITVDGDYVGVLTGSIFRKEDVYCKPIHGAVIISVDQENKTGTKDLSEDHPFFGVNKMRWKERYIGCRVTVSAEHKHNDIQVYYCHELKEHFSENELSLDKYAL